MCIKWIFFPLSMKNFSVMQSLCLLAWNVSAQVCFHLSGFMLLRSLLINPCATRWDYFLFQRELENMTGQHSMTPFSIFSDFLEAANLLQMSRIAALFAWQPKTSTKAVQKIERHFIPLWTFLVRRAKHHEIFLRRLPELS